MSQTRVPTTNFCDYYNIEWFPINVSINGTEKVLNEVQSQISIKRTNPTSTILQTD